VEVGSVASPQIKELQPRAQPYEAGASGGAPAEVKPPHTELELVTVTPGSQEVEVAIYSSIFDAAERIIDTALEEIASIELLHLPAAGAARRAKLIRPIEKGLFYEILVDWGEGWVERHVIRADKTFYYTKKTYLYFEKNTILVELYAVYKDGVLYYEIDVDDKKDIEIGHELEELLKREGDL
jgi:hypothetical protein